MFSDRRMSLKHLDRLHDVQEKIINKTEDQLKQLLVLLPIFNKFCHIEMYQDLGNIVVTTD